LIITNPFGLCDDFSSYTSFAREVGKPLLIDNASGMHTRIPNVPWQAFSLHHTKPYGVGEGGLALVPSADIEDLYGLVDYASENGGSEHWFGNGKISDISCAFHLDRLLRIHQWAPRYLEQQERVVALAASMGFRPLSLPPKGLPMTSVPLIAPRPISEACIQQSSYVTLAKYYKPLRPLPNVMALFEGLVNLPSHPDTASVSDSQLSDELAWLIDGSTHSRRDH
jgi:hypothetical protein